MDGVKHFHYKVLKSGVWDGEDSYLNKFDERVETQRKHVTGKWWEQNRSPSLQEDKKRKTLWTAK